jgi:steroid delta-isomerase-like uncharacterized protein
MAIAILAGCGGEEASTPPPAAPTAAPASAAPVAAATAEAPPPAPKPSLADLEKKTVSEWYTAFNAHDTAKLGSLYAADGVNTRTGPGGWGEGKTGPDAIGKGYAGLFMSFPDLKASAIRVFQKGDLVAIQWAAAGTNSGEMMGAPATNKKAGIYGCDVMWFDDTGAIKRQESFHDDATSMRQIGKLPGKAREVAVLADKDPEWIVAAGTPDEDALVEKWKGTWPASWSKHDAKAYDAALNDDSEHIDYANPADTKGRAALIKEYETFAKTFPDMAATVEKAWGFAPNTVLAEVTFTGTQKGALGPLKASNKPVTVHVFEIDELKDGKLQKGYSYSNQTELLAAVGALPKPKAPKAGATDKPAAGPKAPAAEKPAPKM